MTIQAIQPILPVSMETKVGSPEPSVQEGARSFKELLDQALQQVDALQQGAELKAGEIAMGDASSFHEAVIASEKASLALQLTVQVQNKIIDAYHEIMRLQI